MTLRVVCQHLTVAHRVLVHNLDLHVPCGSIHTVMGPSGSGKSSLLSAVVGLVPAGFDFAGQVWLNDDRIDHLPTEQRRVGVLFQEPLLFAHMSVAENLLFAVPPGPREQRRAQVHDALVQMELQGYGHADTATLSGGQKTRVALMRAMLAQPQALLLDEPFSKLDAALRERMRRLVFHEIAQRKIAALLVSHDAADIAEPARLTLLG
jgi:putative thiamine transport system ATP-binding protein